MKQYAEEIYLFAGGANKESGGAAANSSQGLGCGGYGVRRQCVSAESQQETVSRGSFRQRVSRFDLQRYHSRFIDWLDGSFLNGVSAD